MNPAQFYKGYSVNYDERIIEVSAEKTDSTETLMSLWAAEFSKFETVNVCFSGGIDSQFVLSILRRLGKNTNVYIFSFLWENSVFNSPDVLHAIRYCEKFGYKYTNVEIDFQEFVNTNKHLDYCLAYKTNSPQIALHLRMLDFIDNPYPIFFGTEVPMFEHNLDTMNVNVSRAGLIHHLFTTNSFLNYSTINNKLVIKDMFALNPKTHYLGFKQFTDTAMSYKVIFPESDASAGRSQPLRKLFYSDLGAELLPPLLKNTGFEILKMHLAKQTGVYNQFDVDYRYPLNNTLSSKKWYFKNKYRIKFQSTAIEELRIFYEKVSREDPEMVPLEIYNFIL
jgi:hypothetical protein